MCWKKKTILVTHIINISITTAAGAEPQIKCLGGVMSCLKIIMPCITQMQYICPDIFPIPYLDTPINELTTAVGLRYMKCIMVEFFFNDCDIIL